MRTAIVAQKRKRRFKMGAHTVTLPPLTTKPAQRYVVRTL